MASQFRQGYLRKHQTATDRCQLTVRTIRYLWDEGQSVPKPAALHPKLLARQTALRQLKRNIEFVLTRLHVECQSRLGVIVGGDELVQSFL